VLPTTNVIVGHQEIETERGIGKCVSGKKSARDRTKGVSGEGKAGFKKNPHRKPRHVGQHQGGGEVRAQTSLGGGGEDGTNKNVPTELHSCWRVFSSASYLDTQERTKKKEKPLLKR